MALKYEVENAGSVAEPGLGAQGEGRGAVRPTLLIGLGGSGKEVLLRLRRLFWEKYQVTGWPVMEYLWFDTDQTPGGLFGRAPDHIDQRVELNPDERVEAGIPRSRTETIWNSRSTESHLAKWLAMDELRAASEMGITQGAKQIRPFGRLAFFEHFDEIQRAVEGKLNRLQARQNAGMNFQGGVEVDTTQREIVIVASLAGGTGSGSFLDFGFLCKHLCQGDALITAVLFLPQVFKGLPDIDQGAIYANGYAALTELNRYLLPRPRGEANGDASGDYYMPSWSFEWQPGSVVEVSAPPFDVTYLLDQSNRYGVLGGVSDNGKRQDEGVASCREVMHMVAESLLLDFEGSRLSTEKRRWRSNALSQLTNHTNFISRDTETNEVIYSEQFPSRFCSFGLSKIQVNRARLENSAAYLLAARLVEAFLQPVPLTGWSGDWSLLGLEPEVAQKELLVGAKGKSLLEWEESEAGQVFDKMEKKVAHLYGHIKNNENGPEEDEAFGFYREFENILTGKITVESIAQDGPKNWREYLSQVANQFGQFFSECDQRTRELRDQARAQLAKALMQAGKGTQEDGEHTKRLHNNRVQLQRAVCQRIQEEVLECLARPDTRGVSYASHFLGELEGRIKKVREDIRAAWSKPAEDNDDGQSCQSLVPISRQRADDQDLARLRFWSREAEDMPAWPLSFFFSDGVREWHQNALQDQAQVYEGEERAKANAYFLENLRLLLQRLQLRRQAVNGWARQALGEACLRELEEALNQIEIFRQRQWNRLGRFERSLSELSQDLRKKHQAFNASHDSTYIRDLNLGWDEAKFLEVIASALKVEDLGSHGLELFKEFLTNHQHEGRPVVFNVGVGELLDLVSQRDQNATAWDDFRQRLESFCQDRLRGFSRLADIPTVLGRLEHLAYHDPAQTQGILSRAIKGAAARMRPTSYGKHLYGDNQRRGLLGAGNAGHPALDVFIKGRSERLNNISLGETFAGQLVEYGDDSIVLYEEQVAVPLFLMGGGARVADGLAALEQAYNRLCLSDSAAPDNIFKRHIDRHYQRLCSVLPPEDDQSTARIIQGYRPLLLGLALGLVRHDPQQGFYRQWEEKGLERESCYRNHLLQAVRFMSEDDCRDLNAKIEGQLAALRGQAPDKLLELLALMIYWQNRVFRKRQNLLHSSVHKLRKDLLAYFEAEGLSWENGLKGKVHQLLGQAGPDAAIDYQEERMDRFSQVLTYKDDLLEDDLRVLR